METAFSLKPINDDSSGETRAASDHDLSTRPPPGGIAGRRLKREWKTMRVMVRCYCRGRHGGGISLCADCQGLLDYATHRLERCRFGAEKPTCAKCPVHCYQRHWREQMKAVMRYAGPRMIWQHPSLSLRHWLDSLRRQPQPSQAGT